MVNDLKSAFTLKQISLISSKHVIGNRFDFSNFILNVYNELSNVIVTLNV